MSRDKKNSPGQRTRSTTPIPTKKRMGSIVTGVLVGLIVGVAIAVGIALYLNHAKTPFQNKLNPLNKPSSASTEAKPPEPLPAKGQPLKGAPVVAQEEGQPATPPAPVADPNAPIQSGTAAQEPTRFDFYNILPGKDQVPNTPRPTKPKPEKPKKPPTDTEEAPDPKEPEKPKTVTKPSILQAGSFKSETDADNLKARLSLLGVNASIQTIDLGEKGVWHRVKIGPVPAAQVDSLRSKLQQHGIEPAISR